MRDLLAIQRGWASTGRGGGLASALGPVARKDGGPMQDPDFGLDVPRRIERRIHSQPGAVESRSPRSEIGL